MVQKNGFSQKKSKEVKKKLFSTGNEVTKEQKKQQREHLLRVAEDKLFLFCVGKEAALYNGTGKARS